MNSTFKKALANIIKNKSRKIAKKNLWPALGRLCGYFLDGFIYGICWYFPKYGIKLVLTSP